MVRGEKSTEITKFVARTNTNNVRSKGKNGKNFTLIGSVGYIYYFLSVGDYRRRFFVAPRRGGGRGDGVL